VNLGQDRILHRNRQLFECCYFNTHINLQILTLEAELLAYGHDSKDLHQILVLLWLEHHASPAFSLPHKRAVSAVIILGLAQSLHQHTHSHGLHLSPIVPLYEGYRSTLESGTQARQLADLFFFFGLKSTHVSHRVIEKHICLCFNPSAHLTSCEAAREEEVWWSLKACSELASSRGCSQNRSQLVLEGLRWPCVVSMLLAKKKPSGP